MSTLTTTCPIYFYCHEFFYDCKKFLCIRLFSCKYQELTSNYQKQNGYIMKNIVLCYDYHLRSGKNSQKQKKNSTGKIPRTGSTKRK